MYVQEKRRRTDHKDDKEKEREEKDKDSAKTEAKDAPAKENGQPEDSPAKNGKGSEKYDPLDCTDDGEKEEGAQGKAGIIIISHLSLVDCLQIICFADAL